MIYRRLDANYDYSFGHGKQDFLTDVEAVGQAILTRLWLLYGEWWEDEADGLPLWQSIIGVSGGPQNKQAADALIKERIAGTLHVKTISDFSSTYDTATRAYTFQCTVDTDYGQVNVNNINGQLTSQGVG
jgi:hypothetical protein